MSAESPPVAADDPRVIAALDEYVAALEAGRRPNRAAFLAAHPDVAGPLADCLDGLDLVHDAAARLGPPVPEPDLADATPLGDFRLLRVIGRGGMGTVYEAEQLSLGRRVALKVLPFAAALDARQRQRFQNEAQAAAHLHHPHIVPVYFVGQERGVHFYAMQLIDGRTLAALIDDLRGPPGDAAPPAADTRPQAALSTEDARPDPQFFRRAARLGLQAAQALEHAHQVGVVHRDVKPANLLVDDRDHLWVTDFGLAQFQGHAGLTMTGDVLGTLRYMSPEQAAGQPTGIDHRTDVYSLGATLYELLTLHPVVAGTDRAALVRQILDAEPVPPRRVRPAVPHDLETIVLKALARDPADRYPTAQAMADDLQRFLDDRPVAATRPGVWRRVRKWARRHRPVVATAAVAGVLLLVTAVVVLSVSMARIKEEEKRKDKALELAEAQRRRAEENFERAFHHLDPLLSVGGVRRDEGPDIDSPEVSAVRRELLERTLRAYQRFLVEPTDDPASRYEASIVLLGTSRLHHRLGQAADAGATGRRAQALADGLVAEFPGELKYARQQSVIDGWLGYFLAAAGGSREEAERLLRRAISFWEAALAQAPAAAGPSDHWDRGVNLKGWAQAPNQSTCHYYLASFHGHLANAVGRARLAEYTDSYLRSAHHWRLAAALSPGEPEYLYQEVMASQGLGYLLCDLKRTADGLATLRHAADQAERLAEGWPAVARYRKLQPYVLDSLGVNLRMAERPADAEAAHAEALRRLDVLDEKFKGHDVRDERSRALFHRALALWLLDRRDEALAAMREVLPLVEGESAVRPASHVPSVADVRHALGFVSEQGVVRAVVQAVQAAGVADARQTLRLMFEAQGKRAEAEAEYRAALTAVRRPPDDPKAVPAAEHDRITVYVSLARFLARTARGAEAESLRAELRAWTPTSPGACNHLAWMLVADPDPKRWDPVRAVELAEKAVAGTPEDGTYWNTLGVARYRREDWTGAVADLEKSRAVSRQAHDSFNTFFLAMAHWRLGDRAEARRWYDLAVVWMEKNLPKHPELVRFRAEAKALLEPKAN